MSSELTIYNTLTRQKEKFVPVSPPFVGLYVCGPTVYNEVHLGNLRSFTTFDMVCRYLRHLGYKVRYVRNITDVGHITTEFDEGVDRIGTQAKREQKEPMEIVQQYTNSFHEVTRMFNLLDPNIEPSATGHIIEQIEMIREIIDNGFAYEANGSVYFDVKKFNEKHEYGKLSGRNVEELMENTRELDGQEEKRFFADFALWKKASPEHIMRWPSPWSEGFPGWHLECSAMSKKYLGTPFDIHGGGMDLKFPHHECEIAQNVGSCGKEPVNYWMHGNMLTVNGTKMSKSLGNSFLPRELVNGDHPMLEKGYSPMTIRFFMMQTHYRSTLDFSTDALNGAEKAFVRLMNSYDLLKNLKTSEKSGIDVKAMQQNCYDAMNDDFNTAVLLSHLFEAVRFINSIHAGTETISADDLILLKKIYSDFVMDILGLKEEVKLNSNEMDGLMNLVLSIRNDAKQKKDFSTSDKIRDELLKLNFIIKDEKGGTTWGKN